MAVTAKAYGRLGDALATNAANLSTHTFKVALFTAALNSSNGPAQDTNQYFDAAPYTSNELSGGGYARQTLAFTGVTRNSYDSTTKTTKFDADDIAFGPLTTSTSGEPRYAIIYDDTPANNKPLVGYVDFGQSEQRTNQDLAIVWATAGVVNITAS